MYTLFENEHRLTMPGVTVVSVIQFVKCITSLVAMFRSTALRYVLNVQLRGGNLFVMYSLELNLCKYIYFFTVVEIGDGLKVYEYIGKHSF